MVLEPVERLELLPLCFASLYLPCHMPPHARARVMADATEENASDDDAVKMGRHGVTRGKLSVAEHSAGAGAHDGAAAAAAAAARLLPAAPAAHVCAGAGSAAGLLSAPASRTAWRARGALSSACFKVLKVRRHAAARLCAGHDTGLCERWTVGAALGLDALLWRGPRGVEHFCCVAARSTSAVLLRGRAPAFISSWCLFHELLLHQLLVHQLFGASPAGCCFWRPRLHYRLLTLYPAAY